MTVRKANAADIDAVAAIYERIHTAEERGEAAVGWQRGVYPERETALAALAREDLFVMEDAGCIVGTAILNRIQVDVYVRGKWEYAADPDGVMVMHTLVIDPARRGRGYGKGFVRFYEDYARENGCPCLRMDTNEKNSVARRLYHSLGYREIGVVPCVFNGLPGVNLVLLEKHLEA